MYFWVESPTHGSLGSLAVRCQPLEMSGKTFKVTVQEHLLFGNEKNPAAVQKANETIQRFGHFSDGGIVLVASTRKRLRKVNMKESNARVFAALTCGPCNLLAFLNHYSVTPRRVVRLSCVFLPQKDRYHSGRV